MGHGGGREVGSGVGAIRLLSYWGVGGRRAGSSCGVNCLVAVT